MVLPGEFDHASPLVRELAYEKSSCADPKYLANVERQSSRRCARPTPRRRPVRGFGKGIEDQVALNRRFRMKNGLHYTHPGQGIPTSIGRPVRSTRRSA